QPVYTEVTVTEGEVAEVAAPKFTDEETGEERDMPEGTTFALKNDIEGVWIDEETGEIKSSATNAAPATNVYEVVVTYPDGSSETV
ncbi:Rib/alpha-like domain-containing protein, partial [Gulosibacter sp. GYB002]|uniref:Rib/alpha-like domain-containing protein n=1 Tax=Gulosibacter sp. GYB002 TaxID=2994391 RepID=UPI002F962D72